MRKYVTFNISVEGVELSSGAKANFYDVEVGVMADLDPGCPETGLSEGIQYTCDKVASHTAVELAIHKWLADSVEHYTAKYKED